MYIKGDATSGPISNGVQEPILFRFALDKTPGLEVFCEPETKSQKNVNESVSNKISFLLEDEESSRANFIGKTMTFILVLIKNQV